MNNKNIIAILIYELLPAILSIALVVYLTMKMPIFLVGMTLGYMACKYHSKLIELKDLYIKKIDEMKSDPED